MFKSKYLFLVLTILLLTMSFQVMAQDDVIEIEYWQYNFGARVDAMNMLIEQFEAENPGIKVVHNSDIAYADFRTELGASVAGGVGPDVVSLFYGWIPEFVDAGYLVPLPEPFNEEFINEHFVPMVAGSAAFEGEYYAVPTAVRSLALFYNIDLLEAAGFDGPPETLDEMVEIALATVQYDGDPAVENIVVNGYAAQPTGQAHHWFREVLIRQFGGQSYNEDYTEVMWDTEAACEAFTFLTDFEVTHITGTNEGVGGTEDAQSAFIAGLSALHIDGSFRLPAAKANEDLNFGIAELPAGPDGSRHTYGSYWTHGITRRAADDEARMEAATKFLEFITTAEAGTLWVNEVGELPAQNAAASDPAILEDPFLGPFSAGLAYSHATFFIDESVQRQHIIDAFDLVRLEGMDPCDALAEAAFLEQELLDDFWDDR